MSNKIIDVTSSVQDDSEPYEIIYSKVFENLKVFSLAKVKEISKAFDDGKKYGIVKVNVFPLESYEDSSILEVYCFSKTKMQNLSVGDIVGVIYSDMNFKYTLDDPRGNILKSPSSIRHSKSYGVLINITD